MFTIATEINSGTVDELESRMSESELQEWAQYFKIRQKEQEKHRKKLRNKRPGGRRKA